MAELLQCPECMGNGEIQYEFLDYLTQTPDTKMVKCDTCNGTGQRS
jgi:DnaJ-class molecular chaperone